MEIWNLLLQRQKCWHLNVVSVYLLVNTFEPRPILQGASGVPICLIFSLLSFYVYAHVLNHFLTFWLCYWFVRHFSLHNYGSRWRTPGTSRLTFLTRYLTLVIFVICNVGCLTEFGYLSDLMIKMTVWAHPVIDVLKLFLEGMYKILIFALTNTRIRHFNSNKQF